MRSLSVPEFLAVGAIRRALQAGSAIGRRPRIIFQPKVLQQCLTTTKIIRVNRSIQAEGVFAMVKEDMNFRKFMLRGSVKVEVEWMLLSLAYNILKLHHKAQKGRLGTGLVVPKGFPAGL